MNDDPLYDLAQRIARDEAIRSLYATGRYSYRTIAAVFSVSHMTVYRAVNEPL